MSHLYPLAETAAGALESPEPAARTRPDAERFSPEREIVALETEWLEPGEGEAETLASKAAAALGQGFVQVYEDAEGRPVYAVTFWKLGKPVKRKETPAPKPRRKPARSDTAADDTDDLYFKQGRTRRRRKRHVDPRQLDLFLSPDLSGYDRKAPDNPDIILAEEEGDGTTFGGE